ncbi:unnamed protein product [Schistosoma spindalis]|nr:unnamed protein product [Schistosoma spindale]
MFMTALVFAIDEIFEYLFQHNLVAYVLIFISIGATIAIFFIQRFPHLKYLTDFLYVLLTFSFAGVITCLSINVEGMFIFISWILAIILSVLLFIFGINIKRDLVTWAIGPLVLAIVIPASLIEAQIFCGGRAIYYRSEDFIFASMVHLFLLTFSYSGFILLFLNIKLS